MVGDCTEPYGGGVIASGRARIHSSLAMPALFAGSPSGPTSIPGEQTGSGAKGSWSFGASEGSKAMRASQRRDDSVGGDADRFRGLGLQVVSQDLDHGFPPAHVPPALYNQASYAPVEWDQPPVDLPERFVLGRADSLFDLAEKAPVTCGIGLLIRPLPWSAQAHLGRPPVRALRADASTVCSERFGFAARRSFLREARVPLVARRAYSRW